ncbi:D-alanyl-D-alanine carboxypeptidase family protein [Paenibacillus sp. L3-i20]|uniref:M15 family metallopeptidase n=1 Tax=Paenibacillus sp. L3-i20 TaxID=2905833 RepID=UPI001EDE600C|nr:M15 family metallopeptidase [Paenibacillus sp. L3-i20]GKU78829.1 D-Ala-D-Ala carboxypeptidase VanY [Paenibacillus sp. L3-i20]
MKKWIFGIVLCLLLGSGIAQKYPNIVSEISLRDTGEAPKVTTTPERIDHALKAVKVTSDQIYKGNLLLVNKDIPIQEWDSESNVIHLSQNEELFDGFGLMDDTIQLSPNLLQKFSTMIEAAEKDGVNHFIINSGYRDMESQHELYQQLGPEVAMPAGHSEHNLGLSIDIGSALAKMDQAPEGKWLKDNAWKYGFILRYPEDKTEVTGTMYEPWHYRYVGLPHSAIMQENNFVLEEYLNFLKEKMIVTTTIDQQNYEISYYSVSRNTSILVPRNGHYEISGNNVDGVIVTVHGEGNE